jgi:peptidyl-prolyl cis-trans isomerase D
MISTLRRSLDTWIVRALFMGLALAFIVWGVGDVVTKIGSAPTWVAKVGGHTIELPEFQSEYQRTLNLAMRNLPPGQDVSAELRQRVGDSVLQRLINEAALRQEMRRLRIDVPDDAVRAATVAMPAFHDPSGQFSPQVFQAVLANNGLTEARFAELMRVEIGQRQVLETLAAGGQAPRAEAAPIFTQQFEKRSADTVEFPFAAEPAAPTPSDAELRRWYANHPFDYSTPAMRRINLIVLAPSELEKGLTVTDAELQAEYQQLKSEYVTPPKRSAQVLTLPDATKAAALAAKWRGGADWTTMQGAAQQAGGSAVALDEATNAEFPDAALANVVFSAAADTVSAPVHGSLGWFVVKVTKITPGAAKPFEAVKDQLTRQILDRRAADMMYDRANKIDDLLGNGTPFDKLPGNLGLVALSGTLDAKGNTRAGTPAPLPGPVELREAIISATFKAEPGAPTELTEVQTPSVGGSAYFALQLEATVPPAVQPYDDVKPRVQADWNAYQLRHAAETAAAKLLAALKGGQSIADAAAVAGVPVRRTALTTRDAAPQQMAAPLADILFSLKKGEPTMVQTPTSFIVAVPAEIELPSPSADPAGYAMLRDTLNRSIGNDIATLFTDAVRVSANAKINHHNLDSVVQAQE